MKMRPDGGRPMASTRVCILGLLGEIVARRQSLDFCTGPEHRMALKVSRKPLKLHRLAWGPACRLSPIRTVISTEIGPTRVRLMYNPPRLNRDSTTPTRPGYVIDDGPRNEAPGDADCRASRRGADRPDLDVLVSRPGRLAPGGRGANPRRDRPRSGDQRQYRRFGVSRKLRLLS